MLTATAGFASLNLDSLNASASPDQEIFLYDASAILSSEDELEWPIPFLIQNPGLIICVGPSKIGKTTFMVTS